MNKELTSKSLMVIDGQIIMALNNEECYNTMYFKNKRKNKSPMYTQTPFCCVLYNGNANGLLSE
jgi:hypothetical protein